MEIQKWWVDDKGENLPIIWKKAVSQSGDIKEILTEAKYPSSDKRIAWLVYELSKLRRDGRWTNRVAALQKFWIFAKSKYILETDEQFLRPTYFAMVGGDCDDQAIFSWQCRCIPGRRPERNFTYGSRSFPEPNYPHICSDQGP